MTFEILISKKTNKTIPQENLIVLTEKSLK